MNNTPYLNIGEVAEYLKLSRETLYKYVQRGLIPAIKIGRHWRFHRESLDSWLNQQVKDSGQPEPAYLVPPLTHSRPNLPLNVLVVDDDPSIRLILRVWMR
ncbi:MAG: helix-turn-helix domain-containing protein, partial [Kiritimatiellia bacterium]|nr:helix-turn-helix domain-containing protein [Kiritimatiellia bacterium]